MNNCKEGEPCSWLESERVHEEGVQQGEWGFVAHYIAEAVADVACPMCGETHATELGDHVDERTGGWASARTAQGTAHFRLAIAATSAGPFRLHGGRAA